MSVNSGDPRSVENHLSAEQVVAKKLKGLRLKNGFSLRALAERSGLNINTLSLVENGKSSPSVSTLQQLAMALEVPIAAFFESEQVEKNIIFTRADRRPEETFGSTRMQNLGKNLSGNIVQPFIVTLQPGMGSGDQMIVHTGFEFVYCLSGVIDYQIEQEAYTLHTGDSLLFTAHLPHCWENKWDTPGEILMVFYPSDEREQPGGRHFSLGLLKKEMSMKIAAITDDGKTISQHFGRAHYYLVMTIEEGNIINREMRNKMGHTQLHQESHEDDSHGAGHGMDAGSHDKHVSMADAIADCKALLCGGMGMGAYDSMRRLNIRPVVTDLLNIDEAAQAFIEGKLIDHTELLH